MRFTVSFCAAVASIGFLLVGAARTADAADPKGKSKKSSDDGIGKTLQWEDNVMGPDDKRGELDKIAKAQAINKAATEKAAREKEKADKEAAAREAKEAAAPKAQTSKRGGEVALPTLPDEEQGSKKGNSKPVEISPKLETATAAPPPAKPADDKFIDKLLKEEGSGKKKKASASNDKALLDILSTEPAAKPAGKKGKKDGVDSLLVDADKEPAAPAPKIKHETPEWMKPEIQATSTPAPAVVKSAPRRDDGVIHVVQGAAGTSTTPSSSSSRGTSPAARPAPAPTRSVQASMTSSSSRRQAAAAPSARGGNWNDPFADAPRKNARPSRDLDEEEAPAPRRNTAAVRQARDDDDDYAAPRRKSVASRSVRDDDNDAPPVRRNASAPAARNTRGAVGRHGTDDDAWDDPFDKRPAGGARRASAPAPAPKPAREPARTAPSGKGKWDDPFTEKGSAKPARGGAVAMREESTPSKWGAASKRSSSSDESGASDSGSSSSKGRWGILKKR
jgi:hypothetical protein